MAVQRFKVDVYSYCWYFLLITSLLSMTAETTTAPAKRLLEKFGSNYSMNAAQTANLFDKMGIASWDFHGSEEEVKFF
mgnify:FL=1